MRGRQPLPVEMEPCFANTSTMLIFVDITIQPFYQSDARTPAE